MLVPLKSLSLTVTGRTVSTESYLIRIEDIDSAVLTARGALTSCLPNDEVTAKFVGPATGWLLVDRISGKFIAADDDVAVTTAGKDDDADKVSDFDRADKSCFVAPDLSITFPVNVSTVVLRLISRRAKLDSAFAGFAKQPFVEVSVNVLAIVSVATDKCSVFLKQLGQLIALTWTSLITVTEGKKSLSGSAEIFSTSSDALTTCGGLLHTLGAVVDVRAFSSVFLTRDLSTIVFPDDVLRPTFDSVIDDLGSLLVDVTKLLLAVVGLSVAAGVSLTDIFG